MKETLPIEVSVIILTYRQADTIGRAIESVLAQRTDFRYEIILADDCSPDATGNICRQYAERYPDIVKYIERKQNIGLVANYFDSFAKASGRFIADCAGDDFWIDETSLQERYDLLVSDDRLSLVHADWVECDPSGNNISSPFSERARFGKVTSGIEMRDRLLAHEMPVAIHLSTALYRADRLREALSASPEIIYNKQFRCEDLPLMAALLSLGDVGYLHKTVLAYTVGGDTVSSPADRRKAFDFYEASARCTLALASHYGVSQNVISRFIYRRVNYLSSIAFTLRDRTLKERVDVLSDVTGIKGSWKTRIRRILLNILSR